MALAGAGEVAVQLAEVGHARVGGEVRLQVDHALERAAGRGVAAELDLGVDDHAVAGGRPGRGARRGLAEAQAAAEVVARERQGRRVR